LPELRRHVNFREIDGVVISHLHLDHMLDVLALRFALCYNPVAPRRPVPLWLPPGGLALLHRLAHAIAEPDYAASYFDAFDAREYDPDSSLAIGELVLRFHPTVHFIPCWAMRITNGHDGDLVYTADAGPASGLAPFASGARVVVAEGTERGQPPEPIEARGHLTPAEAGALAHSVGAETLVLTHVWDEDNPFTAIKEAEATFGASVALATPGLRLAWTASD
jgi:ribonuclease BN (tRNA processing enzyme)